MANLKRTSEPKLIPERTVERLSEYRRVLLTCSRAGVTHIYSHQLASMHGITAVQVRRDLMLIGFTSDTKKGYDVKDLIGFIGNILDEDYVVNVCVIGMGKLGSAITSYFNGKRSKLKIVAVFDVDTSKVNTRIMGVPCYHMDEFVERVRKQSIEIAMLTSPTNAATEMVAPITEAGIKGVLNFTSMHLSFPEDIHVEYYDMITLLEKVAYYIKGK